MKALELNEQFEIIEFYQSEIEIIINSLNQVFLLISKRGFETRVGVDFEQTNYFFENIKKLKETPEKNFLIRLEQRDFIILHNTLNEVCHGLRIENFDTKIGVSKDIVKQLFISFHSVCIDYKNKQKE